MRKITNKFIYLLIITAFTASATYTHAQSPYRVRDSQVQYLLNRIETRSDTYRRSLDTALDKSRLNSSDTEDMVMSYVTDFENATDALKQKFQDKNSVDADVEDVLNRASYINQFMARNSLNATVQRDWRYLRTDLTTLASYYSVAFDFNKVPSNTTVSSTVPTRVSDAQVQTLLTRIEANTDTFKRRLNNGLDRSTLNNSNAEDSINNYIKDFENSTDQLKQRFDARRAVARDVEDVLTRANFIDGFLNDYRLNNRVQNDWTAIRNDLNTLAGYYNVSFKFGMPTGGTTTTTTGGLPYTANDRTLGTLLTTIETKTDVYKRSISSALDSSVLNNTRSEDALQSYVTTFENATDMLKQNFDARRSTKADVENVISRAYYIDGFMRDYRFTTNAERDWRSLRADLVTLSNYYNVSFDTNRQYEPASQFDSMLTGTYRLNVRDSDVVSEIVGRATQAYPAAQRDRISDRLERRLMSPDSIAIEKRSQNFSLASSTQPLVALTADGLAKTETMGRQTVKVTTQSNYDGVTVNYESDRANDFYVNFTPINNGRQLRVIRRIYLENRNDTITVASVYDKTDQVARFNNLNTGNTTTVGGNIGDFVIPNNTQLTATLRSTISTKESQDGDVFTMEVTSPSQFNGAIISGRVINADKSGRVSGRANLSLDFDTIRLRNGQTYRFAGIIDGVKAQNGDDVKVNNEGTVRDGNQTTKTVTRAGIGAALGALIGAIAGGGQGAAIGAAVGAGAGAGTVFIEGRDNIVLEPGSTVTLTATAPSSVR